MSASPTPLWSSPGGQSPAGSQGKVCNRCGCDVSTQRRYKDAAGYWCVSCHKADAAAYRQNHLPCDDCNCDIPRGQERLFNGHRLCDICHQKRQTAAIRRDMRRQEREQRQLRQANRRRRLRRILVLALESLVAAAALWWLYHAA